MGALGVGTGAEPTQCRAEAASPPRGSQAYAHAGGPGSEPTELGGPGARGLQRDAVTCRSWGLSRCRSAPGASTDREELVSQKGASPGLWGHSPPAQGPPGRLRCSRGGGAGGAPAAPAQAGPAGLRQRSRLRFLWRLFPLPRGPKTEGEGR